VSIVGGLDVHRRQITFDWIDPGTGQAQRGQITPATREGLGRWLAQLPDHHGAFAVEACTGWRFVVEELQAVGWQAYLAEPAETAALRGPKRRAKTDRTDAQLLRELLDLVWRACRRQAGAAQEHRRQGRAQGDPGGGGHGGAPALPGSATAGCGRSATGCSNLRLPLDRPGGEAADEVALQRDEDRHRDDHADDGAGRQQLPALLLLAD
jgi:hypothetical protein